MMFKSISSAFALIILFVTCFAVADLRAQTTGTVEGTVVESGLDQVLVGVNVAVEGTTTGVSTDRNGSYSIQLPAGDYTLVASFIGFSTQRQSVTIVSGETVMANFSLQADELLLDEVVVTGSGGLPTSKLRLGNAIGLVNGAELETLAITDVSNLLQSRTPGVQVLNSSGILGAASIVQLRGIGSLTGNVAPLIYVDGVRLTNLNSFESGTIDGRGGQSVSTLNLINPSDIERVEVLKGASAATLYGSDAANGVIQIFTKSGGATGNRPLAITYSGGLISYDWSPYNDQLSTAAEDFLRSGSGMGSLHQLSASGGGDQFDLFSSISYRTENVGIRWSDQDFFDAKSNFTYRPDSRSSIRIGGSYTRDFVVRPDADNSGRQNSGWRSNLLKPDGFDGIYSFDLGQDESGADIVVVRNPFSGETLYDESVFDKIHNDYSNQRYSGNLAYSRKMGNGLGFSVQTGYEDLTLEQLRWVEQGHATDTDGSRTNNTRNVSAYNSTAQLTGEFDVAPQIGVAVSTGLDFFRRNSDFLSVAASSFEPGFDGSSQFGDETTFSLRESQTSFTSGAIFGQSQIDIANRAFVTLGLRADRSSSFGSEATARLYPKASIAYLLPVEDKVGPISVAKIRASFGQAGVQPDPAAAELGLLRVSNLTDQAAVIIERPGNNELKPSRTTEIELGADLILFNGRVGTELTYYNQRVRDDLFSVFTKPSEGFGNRVQTFNLGEIKTTGIEASLYVTPVELPKFRYSTRINVSTVNNEVIDDGGFPFSGGPFNSLRYFRVEEGRPVGVFHYQQTQIDQFGSASTAPESEYFGNITPDFTGNWFHDFTLFGQLTATMNFGWATGFQLLNFTRVNMYRNGIFDEYFTAEQYQAGRDALEISPENRTPQQIADLTHYELHTESRSPEFLEDGDFFKLREVALSYRLKQDVANRLGVRGVTLSGAVNNVLTISNYKGFDPEVSVGGGSILHRGADNRSLPTPRRFVFRTTLQF